VTTKLKSLANSRRTLAGFMAISAASFSLSVLDYSRKAEVEAKK
jgi:hypothetical protein